MSSVAIIEAYRQQIFVDPKMAPYYLSCLKMIGGCRRRRGKDDQHLTNAINEAYLEGQFASEDIEQAYNFFGFDIDDRHLNNNRILECFYEYVGSPTQENKARQELSRIGKHRESDRLMAASEDRMLPHSSLPWTHTHPETNL